MPYLKDTELVALISGVHLQTVLTVEIFCAAGLRMPVEHQYFTFFFLMFFVFYQSTQLALHMNTFKDFDCSRDFCPKNLHADRHTAVVQHKLMQILSFR